MTNLTDLHNQLIQDDEYREEYDQLEAEFDLADLLIQAIELDLQP